MASERLQRQIDRLLDEAETAITRLDWAVVSARCGAVLALDPENADARAFLQAAERALGPTAHPSSVPVSPSPSTLPPSPTSFAGGRYRVVRFLGEGGKKRVYLCHDERLDRDVAFALIRTEGLGADGAARITREAQAMGRLGDHPHIVSVYDIGDEPSTGSGQGGQPYLVSQLMAGGDVEGLIEKAEGHRLPLSQALRIAGQVCQALEYAHARGIVHRDLKPGNVWLTADASAGSEVVKESAAGLPRGAAGSAARAGQRPAPPPGGQGLAKLGDFGLAVALDRSRLTQAGMMVGTVAYMPPEQAMGGQVDARSDLYSLGAMLYEMVCGRPPFVGDESVAIIGQHLNTPPVAPSWHRPECPPALEALILRLLEKDPGKRPQSAAAVRAALEGVDLSGPSPLAPPPNLGEGLGRGPAARNPLDGLARGVFVGRAREMADGRAMVDGALSGRTGLVLIGGERGIGKSRLAEEIATYAALRGALVLRGRCYGAQGAPPYWPWIQALRGYVRLREPERLRSELGSAGPEVAKLVSEVRERLPGLPAAAPGDPAQERFRLFDAVATFLRHASAAQPLVVALSDLHWADEPTLLLVQFLVQEAAEARLLVVGTYRDTELGRRHPLGQLLGELARERRLQQMTLRGLSREETGRMVEGLIGKAPPAALTERVYGTTEGVPLFIEETVRLLAEEGQLEGVGGRPAAGPTLALSVPHSVREVMGRRLDRLSERANEVLTMAAVAGREFDFALLRELTGEGENALLELLEAAMAARLVEEVAGVLGRYRFTHALIRETLNAELSTTRRVRLHGRIGDALERVYGREVERHAAELAFHFGQAASLSGVQEKAVRYAVLAARAAEASYAYEEAIRHYEAALGLMEEAGGLPPLTQGGLGEVFGQDEVALRRGLATAQRATYRMTEAFRNFRRAMHIAEGRGEREGVAELALEQARTGVIPPDLAVAVVRQGLAAVAGSESELVALLHVWTVQPLYELGRDAEAARHREAARDLAARHGYTAVELELADSALQRASFTVDLESLPGLEQEFEELEARTGRSSRTSHAWSRVGWHLWLGDTEGVLGRCERLLELARRARDPLKAIQVHVALAAAYHHRGEFAAAEQELARASELERGEPNTMTSMARAYLSQSRGDIAQASAEVEAAIDLMRRIGRLSLHGHELPAFLATLERLQGHNVRADALYRQAVEGMASNVHTAGRLAGAALLGLEAAGRRDGPGMELCRDVLLAAPDLVASTSHHTCAQTILVRRVLGVLAAAEGRWNEAVDHLERAEAFCAEKGLVVELAHCRLALSDALRGRAAATAGLAPQPDSGGLPAAASGAGGAGKPRLSAPRPAPAPGPAEDRRRAAALLDQALADYRRLGMPLDVQECLARREILGA